MIGWLIMFRQDHRIPSDGFVVFQEIVDFAFNKIMKLTKIEQRYLYGLTGYNVLITSLWVNQSVLNAHRCSCKACIAANGKIHLLYGFRIEEINLDDSNGTKIFLHA